MAAACPRRPAAGARAEEDESGLLGRCLSRQGRQGDSENVSAGKPPARSLQRCRGWDS
jgi:hypothetical protein